MNRKIALLFHGTEYIHFERTSILAIKQLDIVMALFTFTFSNFADAFIQSDLKLGNT